MANRRPRLVRRLKPEAMRVIIGTWCRNLAIDHGCLWAVAQNGGVLSMISHGWLARDDG